jgi:endonuclease/exonuclease/phosphatase family metal-dependent hydrolase
VKFLLTALLLGCVASLFGEAPPALRIATWNIQNYLLQNRWVHDAFRFDYPKPEAEKALIRQTLLQVRPDILLLQETGSVELLLELRADLAASGLDYPYYHFSAIPDARTGLALLARIEPDQVLLLEPVKEETRILRGVHEIALSFGEHRLRIFHVHLKSRYTSDKADPDSIAFRTRELALLESLLKDRAARAEPSDRFLLAGDFNTPFEDSLLDGLRSGWTPLRPVDATGETWTYHHFKTASYETIDGFWQPHGQPGFHPVGLFPQSRDRPNGSDHRLVVIEWRPGD